MPYSHEKYLKYNQIEYNRRYRKRHPERVKLQRKRYYEKHKNTDEYKKRTRENNKRFRLRIPPECRWIIRFSYFDELQDYEDITKYDLYARIESEGFIYGTKC